MSKEYTITLTQNEMDFLYALLYQGVAGDPAEFDRSTQGTLLNKLAKLPVQIDRYKIGYYYTRNESVAGITLKDTKDEQTD